MTTSAEVTVIEGDSVCLQDIYCFRQSGIDADGNAKGHFEACGVRPQLHERLREGGANLPDNLFHRRVLGASPAAGNASPARMAEAVWCP